MISSTISCGTLGVMTAEVFMMTEMGRSVVEVFGFIGVRWSEAGRRSSFDVHTKWDVLLSRSSNPFEGQVVVGTEDWMLIFDWRFSSITGLTRDVTRFRASALRGGFRECATGSPRILVGEYRDWPPGGTLPALATVTVWVHQNTKAHNCLSAVPPPISLMGFWLRNGSHFANPTAGVLNHRIS